LIKLSDIHINPDNPRIIKDDRFSKLVKSLKEFPKMMALRPIIVDSDGMILGGNMRFKALKELGYKEVPDEWVKYDGELTEDEKRRFIIEDNLPFGEWDWNFIKKDWDQELLNDWGLEVDFDEIKEKGSLGEKKLKPFIPDPEIDAFLETRDRIFISYSGGKDSTAALYELLKREHLKPKIEVLFVETGAEFPDIRFFVEKVTQKEELKLTILRPDRDFYDLFIRQNKWPHTLRKDCVYKLINSTIDKYIKNNEEQSVLVRGGRPDQALVNSNKEQNKKLYEYSPGKWIYNNLYDLDKKTYQNLLDCTEKWPGYKKGYVRTACWCCPFQKKEQWEAMKINHPQSWENMLELGKKMEWCGIKADTDEKRYKKYWTQFY
jgi:3'-phosphoadenosine 5'-phosphosulfate sulfotransferase (PAPS reductase)/FAD synthetase